MQVSAGMVSVFQYLTLFTVNRVVAICATVSNFISLGLCVSEKSDLEVSIYIGDETLSFPMPTILRVK